MASKGTLVGAGFRRSRVGTCSDRDEPEELDGESSVDGESGGRVSGVLGCESLPISLEKRASSRGLGAKLGAGEGRTL